MTTEAVTWIDPGSVSYALDGSSYYRAVDGRQGFYANDAAIIEQETPQKDGAALRFVKIGSRGLKLPVLVKCPDESTFATARRTFLQALNPKRGAGTLQVTAADGTVRNMAAFCNGGRIGDDTNPQRGPGYALFPLSFVAEYPYWLDTSFTSVNKTTFPATWTETNGGDVETQPIWTIGAPCTAFTITNNTTGLSLTMSGFSITGSQVIVIDTRPPAIAGTSAGTIVEHAFGPSTSYFQYLSASSSFFPLAAGANSITITITGSSGATTAQLQYKQAYEGI